jgi:hypothetical protein
VGILDIFGGSSADKVKKLKAKATQKYGDPGVRQKAMQSLGEMKTAEAVTALLGRFTITVEPGTTDAEEKEHTFDLISRLGSDAVAPVREFLTKSEHASSWALRLLSALLPETEVIGVCTDILKNLAAGYSRNPEKKVVLLHFLEDKDDPRIAPAALLLLDDAADDVKIAALKALGSRKHEPAREPMLKLLTDKDTARRVQVAAMQALADSAFPLDTYRDRVTPLLTEAYSVGPQGVLQKRA